MNPETRITTDQIKQLCQQHSIDYLSSKRIEVGFSNEVHFLNNDLVVKFYLPQENRYEIELAVLQQQTNFTKPKVVAHGVANTIMDRPYVFMSRLPGVPLGHVWHELRNDQREELIKLYVSVQKEIASFEPDTLGLQTTKSWFDVLHSDIEQQTKKLSDMSILSKEDAQKTMQITESSKESLETELMYPVFWDIHLDNLLVNSAGELMGLIDFEHVKYAALDYPLFLLRRMVTDPAKFATEENEQYAKVEDYSEVWGWYQQYYPEMFEFPQLEKRIKIYQLLDCLRLLEEWSHNKELVDNFKSILE